MQMFRFVLVVIFIGYTFSTCCKVYCPREMMALRLIGFEPEDVDTMIFRKYEPSDFTMLIDTTMRRWSISKMDTMYFDQFDSDGFQFSKDYEISFPSILKTYRVSDFKTHRENCNCGQKAGKRVSGYVLDGQTFVNDAVYIHK